MLLHVLLLTFYNVFCFFVGVISQSNNKWRQEQRPQTSTRQQQQQQYGNDGQYTQYEQKSSEQSGQYAQQKRSKYQQQPQYSGAQAQYGSQQQQYARAKVYRPQVEYQGPRKSYRPQAPFQQGPGQHSQTVVKAKVQYGNQQINTHVESVSEETHHDQAAVRAGQLVAPGPRPQFGVSTYGGQERARGKLSKYHSGVGNQLSPSYRSKALQSQVQPQQFSPGDGQYKQQEQPHQYRAQQQQYRPQSNQRQVDSFKDTQQKLNY